MSNLARKAMEKARSVLIIDHVFYGCLSLQLETVETPRVETLASEGKHLYYNPDHIRELDEDERIASIAHVVMSLTYQHMTRRQGRDPELWQMSSDYVVNPDLLAAGFKLPKGYLMDGKYLGWSIEEVYADLEKQRDEQQQQQQQQAGQQPQADDSGQNQPQGQQPAGDGDEQPQQGGQQPQQGQGQGDDEGEGEGQDQGQGGGSGDEDQQGKGEGPGQPVPDPGRCGAVLDAAPPYAEAKLKEAQDEWEQLTRQAIAVAKAHNAGDTPGDLERLVEALNKPRVTWKDMTRKFIDESMTRDYSWMKPNRRFMGQPFILPGLVPDRLRHVLFLVDTSGSINTRLLNEMGDEIQAAQDEGVADKVTIIYADVKVQNIQEFEPGDEIKLDAKGGGGTDFREVMKWVNREAPDASCIIFLTDLVVYHYGEEPIPPLLWAVYGTPNEYNTWAPKAPFGEAIHVNA